MSDYTDRVDRTLAGLRAVSFGPIYDRDDCPECRPRAWWRRLIIWLFQHWDDDDCDTCDGSGEILACPDCADYSEDYGDEGSFSRCPCGICGSSLGGNRYVWHWIDADNEIRHESDGCVDCLIYVSNGDEPEREF